MCFSYLQKNNAPHGALLRKVKTEMSKLKGKERFARDL